MSVIEAKTPTPNGNNAISRILAWFTTTLGQILVSIMVPALTFWFCGRDSYFFKEPMLPKLFRF